MSDHKATTTAGLPQYINSPFFTERFLDALHNPDGEIEIAARYSGLKSVDKMECILDNLDYFNVNKAAIQNAFDTECISRIGQAATQKYYDVISNIWYDGSTVRTGTPNFPLLKSIEKYFTEFKRLDKAGIFVRNQPDFGDTEVLFEPHVLDEIFRINDALMDHYLSEWITTSIHGENIGTNDIYLRRGISLDGNWDKETYRDQNYLNSYSLSLTVTEQFCQQNGKRPALINLTYNNSRSRILFFSPFVKNLNPKLAAKKYEQLEVGMIPPFSEMTMQLQNEHDDVSEYMLEYVTQY